MGLSQQAEIEYHLEEANKTLGTKDSKPVPLILDTDDDAKNESEEDQPTPIPTTSGETYDGSTLEFHIKNFLKHARKDIELVKQLHVADDYPAEIWKIATRLYENLQWALLHLAELRDEHALKSDHQQEAKLFAQLHKEISDMLHLDLSLQEKYDDWLDLEDEVAYVFNKLVPLPGVYCKGFGIPLSMLINATRIPMVDKIVAILDLTGNLCCFDN